MAGEQGTENEQISDSEKLNKIGDVLADVSARFDSLNKRLDEHEEILARANKGNVEDSEEEGEGESKEDGDEENEIVEPGEPKEPTVDSKRARKDADSFEEWAEEEAKEPEHRGDAEEEEEDCNNMRGDSKDNDAELDSVKGELSALRARIADLSGRVPAILSEDARERFASLQEQADPAFQAFGDRAPAPMDGETPSNYQRRLAGRLQKHSAKWAGKRLSAISDSDLLETIASDIYADSIAAARRGVAVQPGELREIVTRSQAGHTRIEFEGDASSWMDSFAGHTMRATGKFHVPN